jgi:hypothetical protein
VTGLTAGSTYNYAVASANSSLMSTTSQNSTITISPYVGYVALWGVGNSNVTISWSTDAPANSFVAYGTSNALGQLSPVQSELSNAHGVVLSGLNAGTTYYFRAESTTANGNTGASPLFSFTTTGGSALPAPVITNVTIANPTASSATITWTTDQPASSQVNYGLTTAYGSSSPLDSSLVTAHSVTLNGLTPGTTYNFNVVSESAANLTTTSANGTFATTASSATPPSVGYVAAWGITKSGATVTWSTDVPANTQLAYGTTQALGTLTPLQSDLTNSHGVVLTGLNAGTTYYFVAQSTGANGAIGYFSILSFTTSGTPSGAPAPVISNVAYSSITSSTALITWTTDQASTSQVNYGNASMASTATLVTSHSIALTGLTPNTPYSFTVSSANASGVTSTSNSYSFTTAAASGTAPVVSYVAFWGITSSGVSISWSTDVPSNTSVAYGTTNALGQVSPVQTALINSHGVVLTGLQPSTTYYFQAQSVDAGGNTGYSTVYSFTTIAGAPSISGVMATPGANNTATVSWTTSVPTYSYVEYGTSAGNYNRYSVQTSLTVSPQGILPYVPSGTVHYVLVSMDAYGNQYISPDLTFVEP